jgi:hypothetical protein
VSGSLAPCTGCTFHACTIVLKVNVPPIYRTNITEPLAAYTSSRGTLVASFLGDPHGNSDLASATSALTDQNASYAGFNLLLLEPLQLPFADELAYGARLVTNAGGGGRIRARALSDAECACGGISNGVDGQGGDSWPKVVQGRAALQSVLDGLSPGIEDSSLAGRLIELLTCVTASRFSSCSIFGAAGSPRTLTRDVASRRAVPCRAVPPHCPVMSFVFFVTLPLPHSHLTSRRLPKLT